MRIRIAFCDDALSLAAVHAKPSWLARLLQLRTERDFMVVAVAGINGAVLWVDDATGRRITNAAAIAALDRERAKTRHAQQSQPRPAAL